MFFRFIALIALQASWPALAATWTISAIGGDVSAIPISINEDGRIFGNVSATEDFDFRATTRVAAEIGGLNFTAIQVPTTRPDLPFQFEKFTDINNFDGFYSDRYGFKVSSFRVRDGVARDVSSGEEFLISASYSYIDGLSSLSISGLPARWGSFIQRITNFDGSVDEFSIPALATASNNLGVTAISIELSVSQNFTFIADQDQKLTVFSALPYQDRSEISFISDDGVFYGNASKENEYYHTIRVKDGKTSIVSTEFENGLSGFGAMKINDANLSGLAVGRWGYYSGGYIFSDGVVIEDDVASAVTRSISNLGDWQVYELTSVNERGQIVGSGRLNGKHRGFVLDRVASVPEPATWLTLITGFFLLGVSLRRMRASAHCQQI